LIAKCVCDIGGILAASDDVTTVSKCWIETEWPKELSSH
jgi:hypothetical protein